MVVAGAAAGDQTASIRRTQKDARVTGIAADLGVRDGVDTLTSSVPQTDILVPGEQSRHVRAQAIY